ncbi:MAG: TauD/TfdA family dioxygenase [Micropepsaceae bacterium]
MSTISLSRLSGALGAELRGLDLSNAWSVQDVAPLKRALVDHLVVALPEQSLTLDDLERVTDLLGGRTVTPFVKPLPDRPHVIRVIKEKADKLNFANAWHSDLSYLPEPPSYTLLHALDVPDYGGDTLFQNQYQAFETLSKGLQKTLLGLRAVHTAGPAYGTGGYLDRVKDKMSMEIEPSEEAFREHTHPAVIRHPDTGRAALYLNGVYTSRFEGWTQAESQSLLQHIYHHATNENLTCRVRWAKSMLTVWDNRATQHNALNDYHGQRREMYRTSVAGSAPQAA